MASLLIKFLEGKCSKKNIIYSERSSYFNFNGRIIRVSNHIGKTSSGSIFSSGQLKQINSFLRTSKYKPKGIL